MQPTGRGDPKSTTRPRTGMKPASMPCSTAASSFSAPPPAPPPARLYSSSLSPPTELELLARLLLLQFRFDRARTEVVELIGVMENRI